MGSQIFRLFHLHGDISICSFRDVINPIRSTGACVKVFKLIDIPSRLKSELSEQIKFRILAQNRHGKLAGPQYHIVCVIQLIYTDTQLVRLRCCLNGGVNDTSVIFFRFFCHQHEQTVAQFIHCLFIHPHSSVSFALHTGQIPLKKIS